MAESSSLSCGFAWPGYILSHRDSHNFPPTPKSEARPGRFSLSCRTCQNGISTYQPTNMPAGYSSRCKACNTPLRNQIEAWKVKDKLNTSQIELKLKELGEPISRRALDNHFAEHYDVAKEAEQQYNESQANLEKAAGERVSEIIVLDDMIASKANLHQKLEKILSNRLKGLEELEEICDLPKLPMAYVSLYMGCATGLCQAMKTKQELLGEDGSGRQAKAMETWVDLMMEDDDTANSGAEKADPPKGT